MALKSDKSMIVSFHPLFGADKNILCAGRDPDSGDLEAIQAANAVILPQGCSQPLYKMARENCLRVFPNYDIRFKYPGKNNQIKLFRTSNVAHPATELFSDLACFQRQYGLTPTRLSFCYPVVFKFDWGGEGETVHLVKSSQDLRKILEAAAICEKSGQFGFMLQEYIPSGNSTLRVVVIGKEIITYWRIQTDEEVFYTNLSKGAVVDPDFRPGLQRKAVALIKNLCNHTGIDLAGFDVIFSAKENDPVPMLLEINYFFGRKGLGGSEKYYQILLHEIHNWLVGWNLAVSPN